MPRPCTAPGYCDCPNCGLAESKPDREQLTQVDALASQHKRLNGERGGCWDWQTAPWQLEAVTWYGTYAGQLGQGHAQPVVYRGDGGKIGPGQGYSCAIRKGSTTRAAEGLPRYGKGQERKLFATAKDWLETDQAVETVAISDLMGTAKRGAPLVGETAENSADSQGRVTPMRRWERSRDATLEDDEQGGTDDDTSEQSVAELGAFRSGSEPSLTRNDPARLLLARESVPHRLQAELVRAWQWIEAEIAAYPWAFAREPAGRSVHSEWEYSEDEIRGLVNDLASDVRNPWRGVELLANGTSERDVARELGVTRDRIRRLIGEMAFAGWVASKQPRISTTQP
jgi:hypothetical protein